MADQAIAHLQQWLNNHGARLRVDGIIGPRTRAALRDFQTRSGLPATSAPDQATMAALTRPPIPTPRPPQPVPTYNPRPPPDVLGTGNTNFAPRLRQDSGAAPPPPDAMAGGPPPDAMAPPMASTPLLHYPPPGLRMPAAMGPDMSGGGYGLTSPPMAGASPPSVFGPETGGDLGASEAGEMRPDAETMADETGEGAGGGMQPSATQMAGVPDAIAKIRDALMARQRPQRPDLATAGYGLPGLPASPTFLGGVQGAFGAARDYLGSIFGMGR